MKQGKTFSFKVSEDFRQHIVSQAVKRNLSTGAFVKAVLKKYTKYKEPKEPELV